MNYAHFAEYVRGIEDDIVHKFGVSSEAASRIVSRFELDCLKDCTDTKDRNQLIIEYREYGPTVLAERMNVSTDTIRRRFHEAVAAKLPQVCNAA